MALLKTKQYKKSAASLPLGDIRLLARQEKYLSENIQNPLLHTKKLQGFGSDKVYSFRATRSIRGVFRTQDEDIVLFEIGHRKDIYESL